MAGQTRLFSPDFIYRLTPELYRVREKNAQRLQVLNKFEELSRGVSSHNSEGRFTHRDEKFLGLIVRSVEAIKSLQRDPVSLAKRAAISSVIADIATSPRNSLLDYKNLLRDVSARTERLISFQAQIEFAQQTLGQSKSSRREKKQAKAAIERLSEQVRSPEMYTDLEDLQEKVHTRLGLAILAHKRYHDEKMYDERDRLRSQDRLITRLKTTLESNPGLSNVYDASSGLWSPDFLRKVMPTVEVAAPQLKLDRTSLVISLDGVQQDLFDEQIRRAFTDTHLEALQRRIDELKRNLKIQENPLRGFLEGHTPFDDIKDFCDRTSIDPITLRLDEEIERTHDNVRAQLTAILELKTELNRMTALVQAEQEDRAQHSSSLHLIDDLQGSTPSPVLPPSSATLSPDPAAASPNDLNTQRRQNLESAFRAFTKDDFKQANFREVAQRLEAKVDGDRNLPPTLHEFADQTLNQFELGSDGRKEYAQSFGQILGRHIVEKTTAVIEASLIEDEHKNTYSFYEFFKAIKNITDPDAVYALYRVAAEQHLERGSQLSDYEHGNKPSMSDAPEMVKMLNRAAKHRLLFLAAKGRELSQAHIQNVLKMNHGFFSVEKTDSFKTYESILAMRDTQATPKERQKAREKAEKHFKDTTNKSWMKALKKEYPVNRNALIPNLTFEEVGEFTNLLDSQLQPADSTATVQIRGTSFSSDDESKALLSGDVSVDSSSLGGRTPESRQTKNATPMPFAHYAQESGRNTVGAGVPSSPTG